MGKASRLRQQRRAQAETPHTKVLDAARVIMMAEQLVAIGERPQPLSDPSWAAIGRIASVMLHEWQRNKIALRLDSDFMGALLDSDTDVPLVPDWLAHLPFGSFACSLAEPLKIHDGYNLCHYTGFITTGIKSKTLSNPVEGRAGQMWTTYGPLQEADGIRFLWFLNHDKDPTPRGQTVTVALKGELAHENLTVAGLVAAQEHLATVNGAEWGQELNVLVPLSVQTVLYMAAQEPDLEWIPATRRSRHKELDAQARVGNVGWRVGSALRTWRKDASSAPSSPSRPGSFGWTLPPHIRRAHWHRVRVANRDQAGNIIGNRLGEHGVDWQYEMRWFPPTPVNVSPKTPLDPAVRDLKE